MKLSHSLSFLFIFFAFSPVLSLNVKGCLNPSYFYDFATTFFGVDTQNIATATRTNPLVVAFNQGIRLGAGSFGQVNQVTFWGRTITMKKIIIESEEMINLLNDEIKFLKRMCGVESEDLVQIIKCKTTSTVQFYGCTQIDGSVYLLQERLNKDLQNAVSVLNYKQKNPIERISIMKKIIEKFDALHRARIIHGDIKPENIMSVDEGMSDFRIIDLGLSTEIYSPPVGGSPAYNGKEKLTSWYLNTPATDVYSLAMTFAVLESSFPVVTRGLRMSCFKAGKTEAELQYEAAYNQIINKEEVYKECNDMLTANVQLAFSGRGLGDLFETMKKALSLEYLERQQSMFDFGNEVQKVIEKLKRVPKIDFQAFEAPEELMKSVTLVRKAEKNKEYDHIQEYGKKYIKDIDNYNQLTNPQRLKPTPRPNLLSPIDTPTKQQTQQPTQQPNYYNPPQQQTVQPTQKPTIPITRQPTQQPNYYNPPQQQTVQPTRQPTIQPTGQPTIQPTGQPTRQPTQQPNYYNPPQQPTQQLTQQPTQQPNYYNPPQQQTQQTYQAGAQQTYQTPTQQTYQTPILQTYQIPTQQTYQTPTFQQNTQQPTFQQNTQQPTFQQNTQQPTFQQPRAVAKKLTVTVNRGATAVDTKPAWNNSPVNDGVKLINGKLVISPLPPLRLKTLNTLPTNQQNTYPNSAPLGYQQMNNQAPIQNLRGYI